MCSNFFLVSIYLKFILHVLQCSTLPQLLEQKRYLDMHMNLATHLAKDIKSRQLDLLNDVEEKLLSQQSLQVGFFLSLN